MPARVGSGEQTECGGAASLGQAALCHAKILAITVYLARQTNGKFWAGNGPGRMAVKLADAVALPSAEPIGSYSALARKTCRSGHDNIADFDI